jgi:hypothetical protein
MIGNTSDRVYKDLLTQIAARRCMLFLGSGSTRLCRDSKGNQGLDGKELASKILEDLNHGTPAPFALSLMEAGEIYSVINPSTRGGLDEFLQKRLKGLQPTIGHYLAASFPWRSVVTTNYNSVAEDAWASAHGNGYAARERITIRIDEDLRTFAGDTSSVRIYKPHGSVNIQMQQDACMVVTSEDYFRSQDIRSGIYNCIKSDAVACTTLFVGYSLEDYTFRNLFYALYAALGKWKTRSYSVGPDPEQLRFDWRSESMRQYFNTTLINDNFDTFMIRLAIAQGHLHPRLKQLVHDNWSAIASDNSQAMGALIASQVTSLRDSP